MLSMGTRTETVREVFDMLRRKQRNVEEEDNYVACIADELGLTRPTVIEAVDHLEYLGVVERKRHGQCKLLLVNEEVL